MTIKDRDQLQLQAQSCLQNTSCDTKKLVLIHTGITVGVSLVISLLGLLIQQGIAQTGGLSGIQNRNMLETLQSFLNSVYSIAMLFWPVGLVYAFMKVARGEYAEQRHLVRGFHRWGPVLRLTLLKYLIFIGLAILCAYVSSTIAMTFSTKLVDMLTPVAVAMSEDPNADVMALVAELPLGELLSAMVPMLIIFFVLFMSAAVYFGYRLRMACYVIVDDPKVGAIAAMKESMRMTKRHIKDLFLLDLRFWVYYILSFLVTGLCFADMLPGVGDALPVSQEVSGVLCYAIYAALLLWLDCTFRPRMETTYATAYDVMK